MTGLVPTGLMYGVSIISEKWLATMELLLPDTRTKP